MPRVRAVAAEETPTLFEVHYDVSNGASCVSKNILVKASSFGDAEAKFLKAKPSVRNNSIEIVSIEKCTLEVI